MSRVGIRPIQVPHNVGVDIIGNKVEVKGSLGKISQSFDLSFINVVKTEHLITLERSVDDKRTRSLHGLYRAILNNMVVGVSDGFKNSLELVGVGYRATLVGSILELSLGYSHAIFFQLPAEVTCSVVAEKGKNILIHLQSFDKFLLGMLIAKLRSLRKKDPYKGKGVLFVGEEIRRKAGKSAGKGKK